MCYVAVQYLSSRGREEVVGILNGTLNSSCFSYYVVLKVIGSPDLDSEEAMNTKSQPCTTLHCVSMKRL